MNASPTPMNCSEFEAIVDRVIDELPDSIVDRIENLAIVVEDRPRSDQVRDGETILGLYEGVALPDRGVDYSGYLPDRITIFRLPHLELGLSQTDLTAEIRTTVLHEIAHHLGIDERRLHEIGWG